MRLILSALLLALVAACTTTEPVSFDRLQPQTIRPGLTAAQAATIRTAPDGLRRVWRFSGGTSFDLLKPEFDVRLRRAPGGLDWRGNIRFRLPGDNVAEIARQIEAATGRKAPIQGNTALVPVAMASDTRGRITRFQFLGDTVSYSPHDCQNTPGTCKSVWRAQDGETRRVIVTTSETGGRWFATIRLDPAHNFGRASAIEQRVYSIDRYGLYRDAAIVDLQDGSEPYFLRAR